MTPRPTHARTQTPAGDWPAGAKAGSPDANHVEYKGYQIAGRALSSGPEVSVYDKNDTRLDKGDTQMTVEKKKEKILSAIASRGWFTAECYWNEACELRNAGLIRLGERFFTGGNRKPVWVSA